MTRNDAAKSFSQHWHNGIQYVVDNNPRAVWEYLRGRYGQFSKWTAGMEQTTTAKAAMVAVLKAEAAAHAKDNAQRENEAHYTERLLRTIPYNANVNNYTKITG